MDEIDRLAARGEPEGIVVVAEVQTKGRGRAGRDWQSLPDQGLLCSVLLRPNKAAGEFGAFPLVVGVAVAEAIEEVANVNCQLKWPNDVFIKGKKVAGILITSRLTANTFDYANVGIGINVASTPEELPSTGTSLAIAAAGSVDRNALLAKLLGKLDECYAAFLSTGSSSFQHQWTSRVAYLNEAVVLRDGDRLVEGILRGVDEQGALLIERSDGSIERLVAGDLVRGLRPTHVAP
jgi:BirA family transcriptional regulator, biotin operon repressor / biotin---[acetyl-CoA-carboxylase] ligase